MVFYLVTRLVRVLELRGSLVIAVRAFLSKLDPKPTHFSSFLLSLVARQISVHPLSP